MPVAERHPRRRDLEGLPGKRLGWHGDGELPAGEHGRVPQMERSSAARQVFQEIFSKLWPEAERFLVA